MESQSPPLTHQIPHSFCNNTTPNNLQRQNVTKLTLQVPLNDDDAKYDESSPSKQCSNPSTKKSKKLRVNAPEFTPQSSNKSATSPPVFTSKSSNKSAKSPPRKLSSISETNELLSVSPPPSVSSISSSFMTQSSSSPGSSIANDINESPYSMLSSPSENIQTNQPIMSNPLQHPQINIEPTQDTQHKNDANTRYNNNTEQIIDHRSYGKSCRSKPQQLINTGRMQRTHCQYRDDVETKCDNTGITNYGSSKHSATKTKKQSKKIQCFISKDMIFKMDGKCMEDFEDEKVAFDYFKQSFLMQVNDGQINNIINTRDKGLIIIINIDLHFDDGEVMYLLAIENALEFRHKVRWCIVDFVRGHQLCNEYGIIYNRLPKSSRNVFSFKCELNNPPRNIPKWVIYNANLINLPEKISKRVKRSKLNRIRMSESELKNYCILSWNNNIIIPVVVIKGKKQWIEWKQLIKVNGNKWIGISLRYFGRNKEWRIECIDYDIGRIYYQHRLCGLNKTHKHYWSFNDLLKYETTTLHIYTEKQYY